MNETTSAPDSKRHWRYRITETVACLDATSADLTGLVFETDFDERDTLVHAPLTLPDGTRIAIVTYDHAPTRSFDVVVPPEHSHDGSLIALVLRQFGLDPTCVVWTTPQGQGALESTSLDPSRS
ncbi:MAG: hypothetical protein IV100_32565 [Myxococcales bacterium]|nr:hypothetical protein [Myxococcales bacterium]